MYQHTEPLDAFDLAANTGTSVPIVLSGPGVPPFPQCPRLDIPEPPTLEHIPADQRVDYLIAVYRAYRDRQARFSRAPKISTSTRARLEIVANILLERRIPPHRWVRWKSNAARVLSRRKFTAPPVSTVYSLKALKDEDRISMFWRMSAPLRRSVVMPQHRECHQRWVSMQAELRDLAHSGHISYTSDGVVTGERVQSTVDNWFPGNLYQTLLQRAERQRTRDAANVRSMYNAGKWIW